MNITEQKAYNWLLKQGYSDITFHHSSTPDFTLSSGDKFEVKKVRNNVIWFSPAQMDELSKLNDAKVIVMNDGDNPVAVFPFYEIQNGYWKHIRVAGWDTTKKLINTKIDQDLWLQARSEAVKQGITMQDWLTEAIIQKLQSDKRKPE